MCVCVTTLQDGMCVEGKSMGVVDTGEREGVGVGVGAWTQKRAPLLLIEQ